LKDYINKYSGKLAERNGGIHEFYGLVDVRISKKIALDKNNFWNLQLIYLMLPIYYNYIYLINATFTGI
jgi:hypothetical protein